VRCAISRAVHRHHGTGPRDRAAILVARAFTATAMAAWTLAGPPGFGLYVARSLSGAFPSGPLLQAWLGA
jgi:hypothetical protein